MNKGSRDRDSQFPTLKKELEAELRPLYIRIGAIGVASEVPRLSGLKTQPGSGLHHE